MALSLSFLCLASISCHASDPTISAEDSVRYAHLKEAVGKPFGSLEDLEAAVKIYSQDGDVWWRLGQQRLKAKRYDDGITAYQNALRLGAFGNKFKASALYDIACAYSLKGDKEKAFQFLQQSMSAGFRDLSQIRTDKDFESLHADKRWEDLAATKDVSKMSRDEGWRYDLWLMHREVSRIHLNAFTKHSKTEQDAWVRKLDRDIPSMTDAQLAVAFMKYMRRVGDGHTGIRPSRPAAIPGLPIQAYWYKEGVFINATAPGQKDLLGAEILAVGGKPVPELAKAFDEITPQDNSQGLKASAGRFVSNARLMNGLGLIPTDKEAELTLRMADGQTKKVTLPADSNGPAEAWVVARDADPAKTPLYLRHREKAYWFEPLPELKAAYLQYNAVQNEPDENTAKFMDRVLAYIAANDVQRLIVDVRWNGGGNSFLNRPIVNGIIGCAKVNKPGSLFVITGRQTFSAAQNFSTDLGRALDPIYVGEPTGSSPNFTGESVRFALPYSKMEGSISDLYWQRSWPMDHRTWIAPDLPAEPSFELYKANRDPAMEAIEAYIRDSKEGKN